MFSKNEGPADRAIRVVAGISVIALGLFVLGGLEASVVGIVVAAFGLWLVVTGAIGVCPLYVPLGITTLPKKQPVAITTSKEQPVPSIDRTEHAA